MVPNPLPPSTQAASDMAQKALIEATRKGQEDKVKKALSSTNPNICNADGVTPLMFASFHGYLGLVKTLLAHRANVNLLTSSNKRF